MLKLEERLDLLEQRLALLESKKVVLARDLIPDRDPFEESLSRLGLSLPIIECS